MAPPSPDLPAGTPPRKSALDVANDQRKFEVGSRAEILTLLRSLMAEGAMVTCYFNQGYDFLLTTLIDVSADGKSLVLDYGSNAEMSRKMLRADKIKCTSAKDKIKIEFELDGVSAIEHEGNNAFLCAVPDSLVRLQRRAYYRLETPRANPPLCDIPIPQPDGSLESLQAIVVDISGGGIGLSLPPGQAEIVVGAEFWGATTDLGGGDTLEFGVNVRNVYEVRSADGGVRQRAGCQFVDLPGSALARIQRYVVQVERERTLQEKQDEDAPVAAEGARSGKKSSMVIYLALGAVVAAILAASYVLHLDRQAAEAKAAAAGAPKRNDREEDIYQRARAIESAIKR